MRAVSASGPPSVPPTVSDPNRPSETPTDASAVTCCWSAGVRNRFWNFGPIHVARISALNQCERNE